MGASYLMLSFQLLTSVMAIKAVVSVEKILQTAELLACPLEKLVNKITQKPRFSSLTGTILWNSRKLCIFPLWSPLNCSAYELESRMNPRGTQWCQQRNDTTSSSF
uniref:Putative secreted protein n=1 Tax=Panstrongylus lignarius TaxID=156445 RepID=A0A224Y153_9HEMI